MNVAIVQLDPDNGSLLQNVDAALFDDAIDADRLTQFLADQSHILLVAIVESVVVGQCAAVVHRHPDKPTELYVDNLAVSNDRLRQGIATQLLERMIKLGADRGCEEIWVATEPDNDTANALYRSLRLRENHALIFDGGITGGHS